MLEVSDLEVSYGPIAALRGLSLSVSPGEFVTGIGANGAGKSTLLRTISGLLRPKAGTVTLDGKSVAGLSSSEMIRRGVVMVPEGRHVFPEMTVSENLDLGAYYRPSGPAVQRDREEVLEIFPILRERIRQHAGRLSGGQQQMLAIGRALMSKPRLLLLDEPSLGLAPAIVQQLGRILRGLNERGTTVLLVEQNARMALKVAHRGYVLETGRVTLSDRASVLLDDARVRAAYLGE